MILKSLLLQGFKSFPDKTEIRFVDGMTAIVGPNGSGKSNISDAIRWVLGEQSSRSLRGARMEDVIFSGTQKRRPLGFAEVSLILDNAEGIFRSEHTEIMVTRRYYRSGESEYYLNKKHCRLKDIHELFMDTGLGRDGYSIIGQGRVDEILSLKSEDRREIFEEAAGITKFRTRKEEAERRLAATEENLVRIRDLFSELEHRAAPLAAQAEKARKYLLLRDELRAIEVSLWLRELHALRSGKAESERNQQICAEQLEHAQGRLAQIYQHAEALTEQMHQLDRQTDELRRTLHEREQRLAAMQSRCAVLRAGIQNHEENLVRTRQDQERKAEQAAALTRQQQERRARCTALDEAYAELQRSLTQTEQRIAELDAQSAECIKTRTRLHEEITGGNAENFQTELSQTAAQAALDELENRRDTLEREIAQSSAQLAGERQIHDGHAAKRQECLHILADAQKQLSEAAAKECECRTQTEACQAALAARKAAWSDGQNRMHMLREMQRAYEGFSGAVKRVMKRAESGARRGVRGPVSSLLRVEAAYVTAIETALGASASHLVVETAQDAKDAIAFLRRSDSGRATFLPMDTIKPMSLREQGVEEAAGSLGTADKLVDCAEEYRGIVQNLLARTVVAENLDAALALARAYRYRFRIVTLDGQVIQTGGAMTGGSVSKGTGALARAEALRELERKQILLKQQAEEAERRLRSAQESLAACADVRKQMEQKCAQAQSDEVRITTVLAQHGALLDNMQRRDEALTRERDGLAKARTEYERTDCRKAGSAASGAGAGCKTASGMCRAGRRPCPGGR